MAVTGNNIDDSWKTLPYYYNLYFDTPITDEWVGAGDLIDYRRVLPDNAGCYDIAVTGIAPSASLTVSLWQSNGSKLTLIKKVTTKNQSSVTLSNLLLNGTNDFDASNDYFISVETKGGKSVKASSYSLAMTGEEYSQADNYDDDWKDLAFEYILYSGEPVSDGWLGFGDTVDYRRVESRCSGCYDFSLSGLDNAAQVTFTLWQENNGKLKSIKTLSVKGKNSGVFSDVLLDANNTYFVSVELKNAAQGATTNYTLEFSGEDFLLANNEDDCFDSLSETYVMAYGGATGDEWVGFGDTVDYRKLELSYAGNYTIAIENVDKNVPLTLTLWMLENDKLKSVKSLSVKSKTGGTLSDLLLDAAEQYFVSVEIKNVSRGQSTGYFWSLTGTEFSAGNNKDDDWKTLPSNYAIPFCGGEFDEWVGFGDTIDYRKLDICNAGSYDFLLNGVDKSAQLVLTVYQQNGDSLKTLKSLSLKGKTEGALTGIELAADGSYFLSVAVKGGKETNYSIFVEGEIFAGNNADDNWKTLDKSYRLATDCAVEEEWVGLHDLVDYRAIDLECGGLYNFALESFDSDAQLALTIFQQNGTKLKTLKTLTLKGASGEIKSLKLDAAQNYFAAVEIKNSKKCAGTDYTLSMELERAIYGDNTDDTWAKAAKLNRFADTDCAEDWLGSGDTADWFKLEITDGGVYDWNFNLGEELTATLYKVSGKKLVEIEGGSANLSAGNYALEISMAAPTEDGVKYNVYFVPANRYIEATLA